MNNRSVLWVSRENASSLQLMRQVWRKQARIRLDIVPLWVPSL